MLLKEAFRNCSKRFLTATLPNIFFKQTATAYCFCLLLLLTAPAPATASAYCSATAKCRQTYPKTQYIGEAELVLAFVSGGDVACRHSPANPGMEAPSCALAIDHKFEEVF
ncbi:hypothetical protein Tco_1038194 [Tanacetum coccineum]